MFFFNHLLFVSSNLTLGGGEIRNTIRMFQRVLDPDQAQHNKRYSFKECV